MFRLGGRVLRALCTRRRRYTARFPHPVAFDPDAQDKKRGNALNFNPNGASDVTVDLENNRPPANMLERLLRTWPEMDRS